MALETDGDHEVSTAVTKVVEWETPLNMKDLHPLASDAATLMKEGQGLYKAKGMKRSAVILNSPEVCKQFKLIAVQTWIYATERYIDASSVPDYEQVAINWVKNGIDPGK